MTGKYLLDTNIVIALLGDESEVQQKVSLAGELFLSSVILGELYFGAAKSTRRDENSARIEEFAASCTIVGIDAATARNYGRRKAEIKRRGTPIPENDIWIAANCQRHGLILVSRDRHFDEIEGLPVESW